MLVLTLAVEMVLLLVAELAVVLAAEDWSVVHLVVVHTDNTEMEYQVYRDILHRLALLIYKNRPKAQDSSPNHHCHR